MRPTNLLFVMSDQHNPAVLGCAGDPVAHTPNLDALAARGTRFSQAYCNSPVCVPSRASLATGRYVHELGNWDNNTPYLGHEAPSWGHRLSGQGHRVTTVGKLHYRNSGDPTGFADQRLPMHVHPGGGVGGDPERGRRQRRRHIEQAGPGESEYIRYDRSIAEESARWLREAGASRPSGAKPWALFVSFVTPHFPLLVPARYLERYPPERMPLPVQQDPAEWPRHPALDATRREKGFDEPFDDATVRRALAAYYGLVSFLDEQVGVVLRALQEAGLAASTRVVYTSDHGDTLGDHGLWWKSTMYEGSVGVPLIAAGPEVPEGVVRRTNVSLVDAFPAVLEAVGASPSPSDHRLPGRSLWRSAVAPDRDRTVFSEFHGRHSLYMLRDARHKYVHCPGLPAQLFDLQRDPGERVDLGVDPAHGPVVADFERRLRELLDPEEVAARVAAHRRRRAATRPQARDDGLVYTPAPERFRA